MTGMTMITAISSNNRYMHAITMATTKTTTTHESEQKPTKFAERSGGAERRNGRPPKDSALNRRSVGSCTDEERVGQPEWQRASER